MATRWTWTLPMCSRTGPTPVSACGVWIRPEASAFVRAVALSQRVTVWLEPFRHTRGKYGRLLAYIYLPDETMLNEELIRRGFGYADERFDHMMARRFADLQKQARRDKCGLWREVQPHQWPQWFRRRHDPAYQRRDAN